MCFTGEQVDLMLTKPKLTDNKNYKAKLKTIMAKQNILI